MIHRFSRNSNYFQDKLTQEDKIIYPQDFDSQFNDISGYLNTILKPAIDNLNDEAVEGEAGNIGAYLHNVGDTTTDWQRINSNNLDNYSITFEKLVRQNIGSILISGNNGDIETLTPSDADQVLLFGKLGTSYWGKIRSESIADKTITGNQLGILSMENFVENQFVTNIVPNIIGTVNIKDDNITNDKIQNGIITSDKLGIFANLPVLATGLSRAMIDDGAIEASKFLDNNIPVSNLRNSPLGAIWSYYGVSDYTPTNRHLYQQILKSENILDQSIEDNNLAEIKNNLANLSGNAIVTEAAKAFFKEVPLAFTFQSNHLAPDKIGTNLFDAEVQAAINRLRDA